ncbi:serine hydrolase domain-containing protein [Salipiger sp.]|uniref:serine hydrolase domain-containing protein n=1 Tax=Salipiger sp. TaxID=2078585 RepID=UPI003A980368
MPDHPTRRLMLLSGAAAGLFAPAVLRAQEAGFAARAATLDQLHSLVVLRAGEEVFARAFRGPGLDRVANVKSVSKTLVSLLAGIAIGRGLVAIDAPVLPLLGRGPAGDARDGLTVGHLLSMQTGLESVSGAGYGAWVSSPDWVGAALGADLVDRPGGRFIYSTGGWHVLGAVLSEVTGDNLLTLARQWLGAPLGIDFAPWVRDPQGRYLGGNEMALSPRALARIGAMAAGGGRWNGTAVLPEGWLATSWEPRGRSPFSGDRYGYGWFLTTMDGTPAAYGRGYGGQMLAVVPERSLVVAITSDPTQPARSEGYFGDLRDLCTRIAAEV